jgi:hypothetical protein
MATTLMPLDPATSPQRVLRVLTISARLLPEEIVAARRARRTRGWVLVIVFLVAVLLGAWYADALRQKSTADDDLRGIAIEAAALQRSQNNDYADVVQVQGDTTTIDKQLTTLMAHDLPWATLLETVTSTGTAAGVEVTGITASLTAAGNNGAAAATTGATELPSTSGAATIGTVTVTGTAPDKTSVAKFVDRLAALATVANPFLTSATETKTGVDYSLQLDITNKALCGRFTTTCETGGK